MDLVTDEFSGEPMDIITKHRIKAFVVLWITRNYPDIQNIERNTIVEFAGNECRVNLPLELIEQWRLWDDL